MRREYLKKNEMTIMRNLNGVTREASAETIKSRKWTDLLLQPIRTRRKPNRVVARTELLSLCFHHQQCRSTRPPSAQPPRQPRTTSATVPRPASCRSCSRHGQTTVRVRAARAQAKPRTAEGASCQADAPVARREARRRSHPRASPPPGQSRTSASGARARSGGWAGGASSRLQ